jgi:hypothetical protein
MEEGDFQELDAALPQAENGLFGFAFGPVLALTCAIVAGAESRRPV